MTPFDPLPTKHCTACNGRGCSVCKGNGRISINIEKLTDLVVDAARGRCTTYMLVRTCIVEKIDPLQITGDVLLALVMSIPQERRGDWGNVTAVPEEPWRSVMRRIADRASVLVDKVIEQGNKAFEAIRRDSVPVEEDQ